MSKQDEEQLFRRNSEFEMESALELKNEELNQYKLKLITKTNLNNISPNKILENQHHMNIENKILNIFIGLFTLFVICQYTLLSLINIEDTDLYFTMSVLSFIMITMGKLITYFGLINFIRRCYIGVKIFQTNVQTNILFKLINYQFIGFFQTCGLTIGIISINMMLQHVLINHQELYSNDVIVDITQVVDYVLYGVLIVGGVVSILYRSVRLMTR
ncbi:putative membrane protein [Wickerhamomyces ciferrii]|uniref:Membrane protein n=1 Tax=Wickerhamomyces ciferrii (strain ATCC 14091 / BCRC 22168 / CBS 111 / JCM 3599 / NBRC 0793 / NRRL Y-1031 F-60-10) TaxID=1206466 RepID=K0KSU9_WICCF|nr:uncharacterized protein BN7_4706 [Wickerhamomyces ciferrii]CCH45127.1 putative membrane protein [Wickerhamomyces ciferrii]